MTNKTETINANQLILKSIRQLFDYKFLIPDYQRGYRWTEKQVSQLLDDIWEFCCRDDKAKGEFYCLQPIVVKEKGSWREVIDGQQRLTTIFIILKCLEDIYKISEPDIRFYSIFYSTRKDSSSFLENITGDQNYNDFIDFHFMKQAKSTVMEWLKGKEDDEKKKFLSTLTKIKEEEIDGIKNDTANNVRVIWYEAEETESNNSIDIFTRLNIGKIPLTNAELIKALFLQKRNFSDSNFSLKQIQIASEWDMIEKTLRDDAFWYFIYSPENPVKYDNRIEYIFDLMLKKTTDMEDYYTFYKYLEIFPKTTADIRANIDNLWLDVKKYFLTFEEWYKDRELFHYTGYLIDRTEKEKKDDKKYSQDIIKLITLLKEKSAQESKTDFKTFLKNEIKKKVNFEIDGLTYKKGNRRIRNVLLLFNIQTVLKTQKSEMRFPFHRYKKEKWDIEHVRSQTDKDIKENERAVWIDHILEYFTGKKDDIQEIKKAINRLEKAESSICNSLLKLKIKANEKNKIENEEFEELFKTVQKHFKEDNQAEEKNDISNLALLDSKTNRSYKNSFFPIKRKRIIKNDSMGIFVPIATKNLFLKYYSKKMSDVMYWKEEDASDYLAAIKSVLKEFLPKKDKK